MHTPLGQGSRPVEGVWRSIHGAGLVRGMEPDAHGMRKSSEVEISAGGVWLLWLGRWRDIASADR